MCEFVTRAHEILALWEDTLRKLEAHDLLALVGRLDWVLKLQLLELAWEWVPARVWAVAEAWAVEEVWVAVEGVWAEEAAEVWVAVWGCLELA